MMYARLKIELESQEIDIRQSSNFQGILMEQIDTQYAEWLHGNQLHPYSQFLVREEGKTFWCVNTLTSEAYDKILCPLQKLEQVNMRKKETVLKLGERQISLCNEKELVREFYEDSCPRYLEVRFVTPTAFKQDGKYVIYPDLRLIFASLMRKYSEASEGMEMADEDTLEELSENCEIVRYHLRTVPFPLEKVRIHGFTGYIRIRVKGPETLARYVRLLLRFGEFSGTGIKTGIGMGAMQYIRREKDD